MDTKTLTYRRYEDGDTEHVPWDRDFVHGGESYKCPTYVHRTPPCQGSCPSGHDIRGWLSIVRGLDKPAGDEPWQSYAFRRMAEANPFPAIMGRVCPAPCQDGCNRSEIEEYVGINSIEQYVGDWAIEHGLKLPEAGPDTGKKVAIVGGGPAGLAAAFFLRRRGHACTIFEAYDGLGGMMRYGIPGYRVPRDVLDAEIIRIVDMGVDVRTNTKVGVDISLADMERDFDAVFWGIGASVGKPLPVDGAEAPNCVDGIAFLKAFNDGRLMHLSGRVLVIGGGDTAMDVAAVARRIGKVDDPSKEHSPEIVIMDQTTQDAASVARRQGADVWIVYRRPISKAPATKHEIESVIREGVEIHEGLAPLEVIRGEDGMAKALKVMPVDWVEGKMVPREGEEFEIDCALIVSATGQAGDFTGFEDFNNGRGLIEAGKVYNVPDKDGHFVGGDIIYPHLLTTAIGHASIAAEGINSYVNGEEPAARPKIDSHRFNLLEELRSHDLGPVEYDHKASWGTDQSKFAVHNFEDRSFTELASHDQLFLGHFEYQSMHKRQEAEITADEVLNNFHERFTGLPEEAVVEEADRCMSCGLCLECDNCIIYCPQDAVYKVKADQHIMGRYVETDYGKCIGCHICMDVCPSGYIQMGLGE
ncbi:MAG: NAD(P)-binding protein [Rhodospirillales bacterium]|nr:NAD(P)-binding protein [Rhodospirillales bacterium]